MFDQHFKLVKNVIYKRVKFNSITQGNNTIHQFITELQPQAANCEHGAVRDDLIRDQIVIGVNDSKLREYLIDLDDLTLLKCNQEAKQYVSNHEQALKMSMSSGDNLDYVRKDSSKVRKSSMLNKTIRDSSDKYPFCSWETHVRTRCPARSATCFKCKCKCHWSKTCTNTVPKGGQYSSKAEMVDYEEMDRFFLGDNFL